MTAPCIYTKPKGMCAGSASLTKEHFLSQGLGKFRGYEELDDKVCRDCNGHFSSLEDILLHLGPVGFWRDRAGVKGQKKHRHKSIYEERTHGHEPITLIGAGAEKGSSIIFRPLEGADGRPMRQIVFEEADGGKRPVLLPKSVQSEDSLRRFLADHNLLGTEAPEFLPDPTDPGDYERMAAICQSVFGRHYSKRSSGGAMVNTRYDFPPPPEYRRAIAKIGFHTFLKFFPEASGFEKEFDEIKRLIHLGGDRDPTRFVSEATQPMPAELLPIEAWAHVLYADWDEIYLKARIQLFAGLRLPGSGAGSKMKVSVGDKEIVADSVESPLMWIVHLGRNPSPGHTLGTRAQAFVGYRACCDGCDGEVRNIQASPGSL